MAEINTNVAYFPLIILIKDINFLWLVFITHILITWLQTVAFDDVTLQKTGVSTLVKQLGIIRNSVERKEEKIIVSFPPINELVKMIIKAFSSPKHEQLSDLAVHRIE